MAQTCAGGLNHDPPRRRSSPIKPAAEERLPRKCRKGGVAPLVERFEATLPLQALDPATSVLESENENLK